MQQLNILQTPIMMQKNRYARRGCIFMSSFILNYISVNFSGEHSASIYWSHSFRKIYIQILPCMVSCKRIFYESETSNASAFKAITYKYIPIDHWISLWCYSETLKKYTNEWRTVLPIFIHTCVVFSQIFIRKQV